MYSGMWKIEAAKLIIYTDKIAEGYISNIPGMPNPCQIKMQNILQ